MVEDRGAWPAAVHGVSKSWTWLTDWTTTTASGSNLVLSLLGPGSIPGPGAKTLEPHSAAKTSHKGILQIYFHITANKVPITKIKTSKKMFLTSFSLFLLISLFFTEISSEVIPILMIFNSCPPILSETYSKMTSPPFQQNCCKVTCDLPVAPFNDHFTIFLSPDPPGPYAAHLPSSLLARLASLGCWVSALSQFPPTSLLPLLSILC